MPYPRLAALYAAGVLAVFVTLACVAPQRPITPTGALAAPPSRVQAVRAQAAPAASPSPLSPSALSASALSALAAPAPEPEPADAGRVSAPIRMP